MWTANPSPSLLCGISRGGSGARATPASPQGQGTWTTGAAADQVGGDQIDHFADFLADPAGSFRKRDNAQLGFQGDRLDLRCAGSGWRTPRRRSCGGWSVSGSRPPPPRHFPDPAVGLRPPRLEATAALPCCSGVDRSGPWDRTVRAAVAQSELAPRRVAGRRLA